MLSKFSVHSLFTGDGLQSTTGQLIFKDMDSLNCALEKNIHGKNLRLHAKIYSSFNGCSMQQQLLDRGDLQRFLKLVTNRHFTLCFGINYSVAVLRPITAVYNSCSNSIEVITGCMCWQFMPSPHCQNVTLSSSVPSSVSLLFHHVALKLRLENWMLSCS